MESTMAMQGPGQGHGIVGQSRKLMRAGALICTTLLALALAGTAQAEGFFFRSESTGRWVEVAARKTELPIGSALAGAKLGSFNHRSTASIATKAAGGCDPAQVTVVAFSATEGTASNDDSGIFIYDAVAGTILDVAIEGTATPLGGLWEDFDRANPEVVIDETACEVHVLFRGEVKGVGDGIFDATLSIPALTVVSTTTLVQEDVTPAPPPFPAATTFDRLRDRIRLGAAAIPGGGYAMAFASRIGGPGVSGSDNSGVFRLLSGGGGIITVAREGDPSCPPGFLGPRYKDFPELLYQVEVVADPIVTVAFTAKASGTGLIGISKNDTALQLHRGTACGESATTLVAREGQPTPIGGNYADLFQRHFGYGPAGLFFVAGVLVGPVKTALFEAPAFGVPTGAIVRGGFADTDFSARVDLELQPKTVPTSVATNASGDVVFVTGMNSHKAEPGMFLYNSISVNPPELVTWRHSAFNVEIDAAGNMVALFR